MLSRSTIGYATGTIKFNALPIGCKFKPTVYIYLATALANFFLNIEWLFFRYLICITSYFDGMIILKLEPNVFEILSIIPPSTFQQFPKGLPITDSYFDFISYDNLLILHYS